MVASRGHPRPHKCQSLWAMTAVLGAASWCGGRWGSTRRGTRSSCRRLPCGTRSCRPAPPPPPAPCTPLRAPLPASCSPLAIQTWRSDGGLDHRAALSLAFHATTCTCMTECPVHATHLGLVILFGEMANQILRLASAALPAGGTSQYAALPQAAALPTPAQYSTRPAGY